MFLTSVRIQCGRVQFLAAFVGQHAAYSWDCEFAGVHLKVLSDNESVIE